MPGSLCFRLREQLRCLEHEGSGREMSDLRRICGGGESDSSSHCGTTRSDIISDVKPEHHQSKSLTQTSMLMCPQICSYLYITTIRVSRRLPCLNIHNLLQKLQIYLCNLLLSNVRISIVNLGFSRCCLCTRICIRYLINVNKHSSATGRNNSPGGPPYE